MALHLSKTREDKFSELMLKPVMQHKKEVSSIDLLTINNIFCVISTQRRKELTKTSSINPKVKIDLHEDREFRTRMGYHVVVSGPRLSHYDATISSVLIALYFETQGTCGVVMCTYADIAEKLGQKIGGTQREEINRSITRLYGCRIKIYEDAGNVIWTSGLIQKFTIEGKSRGQYLRIELNDCIVPQFSSGKFSVQELSKIRLLSGEYQPALYRLLTTSESNELEMTLENLYEFFVEKGPQYISYEDLSAKQKDNFRTKIKTQVSCMASKGIIHARSKVFTNSIVLVNIAN